MEYNPLTYLLLTLPRWIKRALVLYCDALICIFSIWMAFGLCLDQWGFFTGKQWWVLVAALWIYLVLSIYFGIYREIFRYVGLASIDLIAKLFFSYCCLFALIFTVIGVEGIPRSIGVTQPLALFFLFGSSRYLLRKWLGNFERAQKKHSCPQSIALIYGAGSAGRQLAAAISINKQILVKGFIDDDELLNGNTIDGINAFHSSELHDLIIKFNVTDLILAIPSASQIRRAQIISALNGCGVRVRTLPGLLDLVSGRILASDLLDLDMNDVLGREVVPPNIELMEKNIKHKVILVTGAGGSIGSELCRQIIKFSPRCLILVDSSESSLYPVYEGLKNFLAVKKFHNQKDSQIQNSCTELIPCLGSVQDSDLMHQIFLNSCPQTVFHAAAYKHVPLVEQNPVEGIRNNVFGTLVCVQAALKYGTHHFILVSTDKAVRPTNVMGASKRIAELVLQAFSAVSLEEGYKTKFSMVRFGNVLGSSGSVAPLFQTQIKSGGPITLTHKEVTRYFMTIPEAAQLVIQSTAMAKGGDVFVLDMGKPVRIYDLAVKMIYLSGLMVKDDSNTQGDIEIKVTGLRPGEKLYEELLIGDNPEPTAHPKIMKAHEEFFLWNELEVLLEELNQALLSGDVGLIQAMLKKLVPGYRINDHTDAMTLPIQ